MKKVIIIVLIVALVIWAFPCAVSAASDAILVLHFDEGSGNIAHDSSGHGNDGTIYGATWVDGISGKALSFNGLSDYVSIAPNPLNPMVGSINSGAFEAWILPRSFGTGRNSPVIQTRGIIGETYDYYAIGVDNEGITGYVFYTGSDSVITSSTSGIDLGQWYYILYQWDKFGRNQIYINGKLAGESQGSYLGLKLDQRYASYVKNTNMLIGITKDPNYGLKPTLFYNGLIDEIALYSRILSSDEIQSHYLAKRADSTPAPTSPPTTPKPAVGAAVTKSIHPQTVKQNQTVTVTVTIENTGTTQLSDIELVDRAPSDFQFTGGDTQSAYASLKPGESRTIQYTIQSRGSGKFTLDAATARFADQSRNYRTISSNTPMVEVLAPLSEQPIPTKTPGFGAIAAVGGLIAVVAVIKKRGG